MTKYTRLNITRSVVQFLIVILVLCVLAVLCTSCATQRYDSGITVNCGAGCAPAVAGLDQAAKPARQAIPAVSNKPAKESSIQGQEVTPPPMTGAPQVIIVQNVSGNEGSTSRSTLMDWLRNLFQGAEIPTAVGQTPAATLNSTGKTQKIDNSAPGAVPQTTPITPATGGRKTTPGATAPGG